MTLNTNKFLIIVKKAAAIEELRLMHLLIHLIY